MVPGMSRIAVGADHAGFGLKEELKAWLAGRGHAVSDLGTHSADAVDYPDVALAVADAVAAGRADRGILVCGTGIGMAMAANRIRGVRAAVCPDVASARASREHNDANVLALGARLTAAATACLISEVWLAAEFAGGRHARRVAKLDRLDTLRREPSGVTAR